MPILISLLIILTFIIINSINIDYKKSEKYRTRQSLNKYKKNN